MCRRFLHPVLACLSGQFYCCVYGRSRHANRKHSVLRGGQFPKIRVVGLAIHDTLIFVATTWVFMGNSHMEINLNNAFSVMVLGRHLLAFSKALMRDGQLYFL